MGQLLVLILSLLWNFLNVSQKKKISLSTFFHFASSENAGDEINEDSQHAFMPLLQLQSDDFLSSLNFSWTMKSHFEAELMENIAKHFKVNFCKSLWFTDSFEP